MYECVRMCIWLVLLQVSLKCAKTCIQDCTLNMTRIVWLFVQHHTLLHQSYNLTIDFAQGQLVTSSLAYTIKRHLKRCYQWYMTIRLRKLRVLITIIIVTHYMQGRMSLLWSPDLWRTSSNINFLIILYAILIIADTVSMLYCPITKQVPSKSRLRMYRFFL